MVDEAASVTDQKPADIQSPPTDILIDTVLGLGPRQSVPIESEAARALTASKNLVKRDLLKNPLVGLPARDLPIDLVRSVLQNESVRRMPHYERHIQALKLARMYAQHGNEGQLRGSLVLYCHSRGRVAFAQQKDEVARFYFQVFFYLYGCLAVRERRFVKGSLFDALASYLRTYAIPVFSSSKSVLPGHEISRPSPSEAFYSSFAAALADTSKRPDLDVLGRCMVEIAEANPLLVDGVISYMTESIETFEMLGTLAESLADSRVFILDPLRCLSMLAKMDKSMISVALVRQSLSGPVERRLIARALLQFAAGRRRLTSEYPQGFCRTGNA